MSSAIAPPIFEPCSQDINDAREALTHLERESLHPAPAPVRPRQRSISTLLALASLGALLGAVSRGGRSADRGSWLPTRARPARLGASSAVVPALTALSAGAVGWLPMPLLAAGIVRFVRRAVAKRNTGLLQRLFAR